MWGFCPSKFHSHWDLPVLLLLLFFPAAFSLCAQPPLQAAAVDITNPLPSCC